MLSCLVNYPLHKLRGAHAPFIKRSSEHNRCVRVYVAHAQYDSPEMSLMRQQVDESMFEWGLFFIKANSIENVQVCITLSHFC